MSPARESRRSNQPSQGSGGDGPESARTTLDEILAAADNERIVPEPVNET
jgi:hypothetical protein